MRVTVILPVAILGGEALNGNALIYSILSDECVIKAGTSSITRFGIHKAYFADFILDFLN
jgi:hypothetical protein